MIKYCDLFWSFFKVGTFTIGGGYAMLPLMQRELVDRHRWLDEEEFLDNVAIAQSMPGVFAVNMAALTGQRLRGLRGAAAAVAGNVLMPIVFILLLALFFRSFRTNPVVERIFLGLRPAVVALIAAPVFRLMMKEVQRHRQSKESNQRSILDFQLYLIPAICALLIWLAGTNPVAVIILAAAIGYLTGTVLDHHKQF